MSLVSWAGLALFVVRDANSNLWLITRHLTPIGPPGNLLWCSIIATPEFLARTEEDRQKIAERFFEKELRGLAGGLSVDVERFRQDFIKTALLPLEEAPIKTWYNPIDSRIYPKEVIYRDLFSHAWPRINMGRIWFDAALLAPVIGTLLTVPLVIVASTIRWVIRGFHGERT
jgi:hypothetical protein